MSFRKRRVLFSTPLFMIFEFFLLKYLLLLFGGVNDLYLIPVVILLGALQVLPMLFEEKKSRKITRIFSTIFGVWEWFIVMMLLYIIIFYVLGLFVQIPKYVLLFVLLMIVVIGIYAYYNAHHIVIKERELLFDNLKEEYNIVHLSDVHFGSIRHKELINDIAEKIEVLADSCDLVIISGDLADGSCIVEEDDFLALKEIKIPIIFTSGNHDYYPGLESVHKACRKANIIVLENEGISYKNLNIYGLSYSFGDIEMPSKEDLEEFINEDMINILNYHVPMGWDLLSEIGFDIQLSGHTHGCQFYPIIFFGNYIFENHNMGLFKKESDSKNKYLHVTTGVGSMDIPMRWGTNSEIVVLKLKKNN